MPILDHTQRKHLSENVAYLCEVRGVPISLLASKAMVDRATLENWLDSTQVGGIKNMGGEQLGRIAEALGVESKSNLYSCGLSEIQERYGAGAKPARRKSRPEPRPMLEAAPPTAPVRSKPGPKPGSRYERRAAAAPCPNVPAPAPATLSAQHSTLSSSLSDSALRGHFSALLENPLVSFRDAVRLAYKALFVPTTLGQTIGQTSGPKETSPS